MSTDDYRRAGGLEICIKHFTFAVKVYRRVGGCVYNDSKNLLGI
jgi:hypothetical protein